MPKSTINMIHLYPLKGCVCAVLIWHLFLLDTDISNNIVSNSLRQNVHFLFLIASMVSWKRGGGCFIGRAVLLETIRYCPFWNSDSGISPRFEIGIWGFQAPPYRALFVDPLLSQLMGTCRLDSFVLSPLNSLDALCVPYFFRVLYLYLSIGFELKPDNRLWCRVMFY